MEECDENTPCVEALFCVVHGFDAPNLLVEDEGQEEKRKGKVDGKKADHLKLGKNDHLERKEGWKERRAGGAKGKRAVFSLQFFLTESVNG